MEKKVKNHKTSRKLGFDFHFEKRGQIIIFLVVLIVAFGCLMVFSASSYSAEYHYSNKFFFLEKQLVGAFIGLLSMIVFSQINYHRYSRLRWWIVGLAFFLLVLVFIPKIGIESYGSKRWINLGLFSFQPSEIAKFAFVLFASYYFSKNYHNVKKFWKIFPVVLVGGLFCLLVILEPNMSITMTIGIVMIIMLFVGGASSKQMASIIVPCAAAVPLMILAEPYRLRRLSAFLDPWENPQSEGFQLIQSLYSIGNGGLFGVGLFCSRQKYLFLPFSESDFIFSIIVEELGFFGGSVVILSLAFLCFLLVRIGQNAPDRFGCLFAIGVAAVIGVQSLINIAVVTGSIPPTGVPLPFISSGSTSLVVFMSAIGICLNISNQSKRKYSFSQLVN